MNAPRVKVQPDGRLSFATGQDRPKKRVFDPQNGRVLARCNLLSARARRGLTPDTDHILFVREPEPDIVARELQNTLYARLGQEPTVINEKPPRGFPCDGRIIV